MTTSISAKKVFNQIVQNILNLYDNREAQTIAFWLLEDLFGVSKVSVMIDTKILLDSQQLNNACQRLSEGEPVQYVTGKAYFGDMAFKVNHHVLIPRPETEELALWIRDSIQKKENSKILDIGTGSGCLAIWLAKNLPQSKVWALDISKEALEIAQSNAETHQLEIEFLCKDVLLDDLVDLPKFDVLVSNPPYILPSEKSKMRTNVLNYEPHLALFIPENQPFLFYERILFLGKQLLTIGGKIYFEINEQFGKEMIALFQKYGYQEIELKEDLFGKSRMIVGKLHS
jgi:release factor glutamine methyltransferase